MHPERERPLQFGTNQLLYAAKTYLLLIQWLESTGLITDLSMVNEGMKLIVPGLPNNQFSTKQLYVANSFKALDLLAKDISTDRGNNAYFVIMDMPAELFIYDSFCNLKPLSQWISADSANTVKNVKPMRNK